MTDTAEPRDRRRSIAESLAVVFSNTFEKGLDALAGEEDKRSESDTMEQNNVSGLEGTSHQNAKTHIRNMRGPIRLRTLTTLRWLAVIGQMAAVTSVHFGLGFPLPLGLCLASIAASAWLNLFSTLRFSPQHFLNDREAAAFIGFDIIQLCALLALTGGLNNPFAVLVLAPVAIAASILPIRPTAAICVIALTSVTVIGLFHFPLPWRPDEFLKLPFVYAFGVWVSLTFSVVFFAGYAHRIAAEAGQMKSALAATQLALAREEQLAAIGGLAAAAAHELGSPLATIQVTAKEMAEDMTAPENEIDLPTMREDANLLLSQAKRCREILGRISRRDVEGGSILDQISFDLLLKEAAEPFESAGDGPVINFETDFSKPPTPVIKRLPEILYGIRNVIENACSYAGGEVLVVSSWSDTQVSVAIIDDGPGFANDILARLGEPYVSARARSRTTAGRKSGMGLGFFIAKTLLERTGAVVQFGNRRWSDVAPLDIISTIPSEHAGQSEHEGDQFNQDGIASTGKVADFGVEEQNLPRTAKSGAWVSMTWPRSAIEVISSVNTKP